MWIYVLYKDFFSKTVATHGHSTSQQYNGCLPTYFYVAIKGSQVSAATRGDPLVRKCLQAHHEVDFGAQRVQGASS
jgi:hypothetical protein